jgi:hypothetical protein
MRTLRFQLIPIVALLAWSSPRAIAQAPPLDICGCRNHAQTLGSFDMGIPATHPPGTTSVSRLVTIPLPADGVMVFDSFRAVRPDTGSWTIEFLRNPANTPITILVKGDVTISQFTTINISGDPGGTGNGNLVAAGGQGGPGAFRGGDGALRVVTHIDDGGSGLGPGGGSAGKASPKTAAGNATFVGSSDLLPLIGGSAGGGGTAPGDTNCAGGGGGGGGGAILIAANGTITIDGQVNANGGNGGSASGWPTCLGGAGGSGGAIRILANTLRSNIAGVKFTAQGGTRWDDSVRAGNGNIRLEALTNTLAVNETNPVAFRSIAPGALTNPFTPTVAITSVAGQAVSEFPQGVFGVGDVQLVVPGPTTIDLQTNGVPTGTVVALTVKPRFGPTLAPVNVTLSNCAPSGTCLASVTIDLLAGIYTLEARATFQTATP